MQLLLATATECNYSQLTRPWRSAVCDRPPLANRCPHRTLSCPPPSPPKKLDALHALTAWTLNCAVVVGYLYYIVSVIVNAYLDKVSHPSNNIHIFFTWSNYLFAWTVHQETRHNMHDCNLLLYHALDPCLASPLWIAVPLNPLTNNSDAIQEQTRTADTQPSLP